MEDLRKQQLEALQTLSEYNKGVVKNMKIMVKELSGKRLDDTDAFLSSIIESMNWELEVLNGTVSLINENEERIKVEAIDEKIKLLSLALSEGADQKIAEVLNLLVPDFTLLGELAEEISLS